MVPAKKLNLIRSRIQKKCSHCKGEGCSICRAKWARCKNYAEANIPVSYWMLAFKDFQGDPNFKKSIVSVLKQIKAFYERGLSLAFIGNFGTGKTYAATSILKMALVSGYTAQYVNMSDVVAETVKSNYEFLAKISEVDFLCLDEYDARYVFPSDRSEQLFGQTMERLLRERFQNGLPTILCSNTPDLKDVLAGDFGRATESLFAKYMKTFYVKGKDYRKGGN